MSNERQTNSQPRFVPHPVTWDEERVTRFWDFFSQSSTEEYFSAKYAPELATQIFRLATPIGVFLDVGCGVGHLLRQMMLRGVTVMGIDSSPASIASARTLLREVPDSSLLVGSITALPIPDQSVDTLALIEVVEHVLDEDLNAVFDEARRVLRPGGHIFVTTRNSEDLAMGSVQCPDCGATFHRMQHIRSWGPATLRSTLELRGFVDARAQGVRLVEATGRLERLARRAYYRLADRQPDLLAVARRP